MADSRRSLLVLGLGNLLCADDGLGVHAVEAILERYEVPGDVQVLDGGTLGLALLSCFDGVVDAILVDAIAADGPPGTPVRLAGEEVAPAVRNRLSCHQIGVADLLDALELMGNRPERVILCGLVPESLELSTTLTPRVAAGMPGLVERVVGEAAHLGYELRRKENRPIDEGPVAGRIVSAVAARGL